MVQTTIRMPNKLYEYLKAEAKKRGLSLNAYLINLLWVDEIFKVDGSIYCEPK